LKFRMRCCSCGTEFGCNENLARCSTCGGVLSVKYKELDFASISGNFNSNFQGMWKHIAVLPIISDKPVTLGEGGTPLVHLEGWTRMGSRIFAKLETMNPTGTYKDRPASVSVSRALEMGARGITVASDGNAAPAVAAYAANANIPCVVFMPKGTPKERTIQACAYGAKNILVIGDINDCLNRAEDAAKYLGFVNCSTAVTVNPYQIEADKTIGFEIVEQLGHCPDWISLPLGGGSLLCGMIKGLRELFKARVIEKMPRIIVSQAEVCSPFVRAFKSGLPICREDKQSPTLALTIAVPYPPDGAYAMDALKSVKGDAVAVTEEELLVTIDRLARKYGILAEPSGAASLAGLVRKEKEGIFEEGAEIVVVITGTGLKTLEIFSKELQKDPMACLPNDPNIIISHIKEEWLDSF